MQKNMKTCDVAQDDQLIRTIPTKLGEREGKLSLADTIVQNYVRLSYSIKNSQIDQDFDVFKIKIIEMIDNGEIDSHWMEDKWMEYSVQTNPDSRFVPLILSCIYSILAERALELGESDKGWAFVAKACYLCGLTQIPADEASQYEAMARKEIGRKGGQAKAENIQTTKKETIQLLKNPPENGWKDESAAIQSILINLMDFLKRNNLKVSTSKSILTKWFLDPEISAAYKANSAETLRASK